MPADAGVRALDAASGSETRYPHRRRPPGERPAVGTMTSVDEIAGASAPAICARATRQVACDKHFLLHRAHVSCLEPHTHLVLQREHATAPRARSEPPPAHTERRPCLLLAGSRSASTRRPRLNAGGAPQEGKEGQMEGRHIVDLVAVLSSSALLVSGVFRRVVVDGESFMDALFAAAGQG